MLRILYREKRIVVLAELRSVRYAAVIPHGRNGLPKKNAPCGALLLSALTAVDLVVHASHSTHSTAVARARLGLGEIGNGALGGKQEGRDGTEGLTKCLAAFCSAERVTLAGSMMPALTMSTHFILAASKPMPFFSLSARSAMMEPSTPAF
jgi:hypothetical protein